MSGITGTLDCAARSDNDKATGGAWRRGDQKDERPTSNVQRRTMVRLWRLIGYNETHLLFFELSAYKCYLKSKAITLFDVGCSMFDVGRSSFDFRPMSDVQSAEG